MKNHKELCLLGVELIKRFPPEETQKVVVDYQDELVAIAHSTIYGLPKGGLAVLIQMLKTTLMLGYEAGKNSKAGDFKPDMWAVAENG